MLADSSFWARHRAAFLIFGAVFGIAISFALYTHHAWEDYYITYRCSKNLATGHGLVFTPGERVHAFTSPLNTLIPAVLSIATGNSSDRLVLWLFRIISAGAMAGAAVLFYQIAQAQSLCRMATFTWIGLFATLPGIVDFSINGQEIGLMMFFLALALHSLMVPAGNVRWRMAAAWTGLMWTRPDSPVYIAAIAAAFLLFNAGSSAFRTRAALLKTYCIAGAITAVLYLPWIVWAWSYFGSPIPHTVIAKGLGRAFDLPDLWQKTCSYLGALFSAKLDVFSWIFAPPYSGFPQWPGWMYTGCGLLAWIAAIYWVLPIGRPGPSRSRSWRRRGMFPCCRSRFPGTCPTRPFSAFASSDKSCTSRPSSLGGSGSGTFAAWPWSACATRPCCRPECCIAPLPSRFPYSA